MKTQEIKLLEEENLKLKLENAFWLEMIKGGLIREQALRTIIDSQSIEIEKFIYTKIS